MSSDNSNFFNYNEEYDGNEDYYDNGEYYDNEEYYDNGGYYDNQEYDGEYYDDREYDVNEDYEENEDYQDNEENDKEENDEYDNNDEHGINYYNYYYPNNNYYNNYYNQYNHYKNYFNNYNYPYGNYFNYYKYFSKSKNEESSDESDIEKPSNDFHTLLQYKYIIDENPENIFNYTKGYKSLSKPEGNKLDFSDSIKGSSDSYIIQISSSQNFDSPDTKIVKNLTEKKYILKNLKLGQTIYYRGGIEENQLSNSKIYKLTTNNLPPRNLDIPGVDNARDIGGYKTCLVEKGVIKQGLYYRTAKIDKIDEEGKKILLKDFGIKVEIDLRDKNWNTGTPFVNEVEYYAIDIPTGTKDIRFEKFEDIYKKVYELISECDKKTILLHCTAGADRTGIMSFSLLSLLGCEYKDIVKDYLFTNFGHQGKRDLNKEFLNWWEKLNNNYEGKNTAEKCKNWLMAKGIEESTLEHIRAIFIDGYKENISNKNK